MTKHGAQAELADLIRSQKELELRIADLRAADARAGGQRNALEGELADIQAQIVHKEEALAALLTKWETHRAAEAEQLLLEASRCQRGAVQCHERPIGPT